MTSCISLIMFLVKCHSRCSISYSFIGGISPFSLSSFFKLLSLLVLRLWSSWSPSRSHLVAPRCFLCLVVYGFLCPFFPCFSFPHQVWVAAMCSTGRRCPCPVGPSLPPCSLLIVQSRGNFRRVVSRGGLTSLHCQLAFGRWV